MAGPLSQDLRQRIAVALNSGETTRSAAKRFGVSVATAVRIGQKWRSGRGLQPGKMGGHRRPVLCGETADWIRSRLAEKADLTLRAGLRHDRIVAPLVLDGPINGATFTAWVEQSLVPTLEPGDVVILDNLGSHKGKPARQAIRKAGAHLLFLSPDLNPIEMMFAKLKTLVRKAEERTIETTWRRVGKLLDAFPPQECSAYLRHAGYASA